MISVSAVSPNRCRERREPAAALLICGACARALAIQMRAPSSVHLLKQVRMRRCDAAAGLGGCILCTVLYCTGEHCTVYCVVNR